MLSLMKKISILVFLYSGVLFQSCQSPTGADDKPLDPKRYDGITSATHEKFRIDSVRVASTYADLYWWDMFDNGDTQTIKYGTDATYSLGTINMNPVAETARKTRIEQLLPNTHYFVKFNRVYDGSGSGSVAIDFTTPAAP